MTKQNINIELAKAVRGLMEIFEIIGNQKPTKTQESILVEATHLIVAAKIKLSQAISEGEK